MKKSYLYRLCTLIFALIWHTTAALAHTEINAPTSSSPFCSGAQEAVALPQTISWKATVDNRIARQHGLYTRIIGGGVHYLALIAGKEQVVYSGAIATEAEAQSISLRLHERACRLQSELENRFGIKIAPGTDDGESENLSAPDGASLGELLSMEYAITRSLAPAKSRRIVLKIKFGQPEQLDALAEWKLQQGCPTIIISSLTRGRSLEYVLMHEFGHHTQYLTGLNPEESQSWRWSKKLGWHMYQNFSTGECGWAIATKAGVLFKYSAALGRWVACNKSGQPVDDFLNRVKRQSDAMQLSTEQLAGVAQVRPCSNYMPNPMEVMAEALAMFRMGENHRAALRNSTLELYNLAKEMDQLLIDRTFGKSLLRAPDGSIVAATVSAVDAIEAFENRKADSTTIAMNAE